MQDAISGSERRMTEATRIVEQLKKRPGTCHYMANRGERGVLWEKKWRCREDGDFESNVTGGGRSVGWRPNTENQAVLEITDDLRIIEGGHG